MTCIFDIDHISGYIYDRRKQKQFNIPSIFGLAYRPRSWFHSVTGFLILFSIFSFFVHWQVVFYSLFFHLLMDVIDKNGIFLLPPLITKRVRGALPVGYLMENPSYLEKHRRSHIPSLFLIISIAVLILLRII